MQSWENRNAVAGGTQNIFQSWYGNTRLVQENTELNQENLDLELQLLRTDFLTQQSHLFQDISDYGQKTAVAIQNNNNTLIINQGQEHGVAVGDLVYANGIVLVGRISDVYDVTSRVQLFTHPNQLRSVMLFPQNEILDLQGNGQGFILEVPREIQISVGDLLYDRSVYGAIIAIVQSVEFDPRDPFQQVYAHYPISEKNIYAVGIAKDNLQPIEEIIE